MERYWEAVDRNRLKKKVKTTSKQKTLALMFLIAT